jgi:hypothetical protein
MNNYPASTGYKADTSAQVPGSNNGEYDDYLDDEALCAKYGGLIRSALNDTSTWRNNQDVYHKQRMRIKKKKIFPHPDCSNLKMPTDERHIRKKKAKILNRIFGIRPIVQVVPPPGGDPRKANKIEKFLDHLLINVIKFYPKAVIWVDKMLESGFAIAKPIWRLDITKRSETFGIDDMSIEDAAAMFSHGTDPELIKQVIIKRLDIDMDDMIAEDNEREIERAIVELYGGADDVSIEVFDIIYNAPDVAVPDSSRVIVPADSPLSPQDCEWICHDMVISYRSFLAKAKRGWKNIEEVNGLISAAVDKDFNLENTKAAREGINRFRQTGQIRIQEVQCWEKLNPEDAEPRKMVVTKAPEFNVILRRISLDALDGKFRFARINNEIIDDRWYSSRGVPEIISDIVREIDTQKNQRIDSQTARNSPMYMYRVGIVNPNLKLKPNKGIPVPAGVPFEQAFSMVNNTNLNAEFSYKDELQQLNAETEELLGEVNFTLQSQINKRQPRTGTEVEAQMQNMMPMVNIEGDMVCDGFSELFQMIFADWCQYGPDSYEFQYFGPEANGEFETIKIDKEMLQGHIIQIRGNDSNTNPSTRLQKAQMIAQTVADPLALQMGLTTPMNVYNAKRQIYIQLGENPDLYVSPPPPPSPPPLPKITLGMDNLTAKEAIQVKGRMGIEPDVEGNIAMALRKNQKDNTETQSTGAKTAETMARAHQIATQTMRENISDTVPAATTG